MIGATAKADQFRERSGSEATKGSRKGFSLLGGGDCPTTALDDNEKRHNLRGALCRQLNAAKLEIAEATAIVRKETHRKGDAFVLALARRDIARVEVQRILGELSAIKKHSDGKAVERHFVDICKETMASGQFKAILEAALRRAGEL